MSTRGTFPRDLTFIADLLLVLTRVDDLNHSNHSLLAAVNFKEKLRY